MQSVYLKQQCLFQSNISQFDPKIFDFKIFESKIKIN